MLAADIQVQYNQEKWLLLLSLNISISHKG